MSCPSCNTALMAGQDRCPSCGAMVAPPVDGALAPDLAGKVEPLREIPGLRKREPTWKDEVRERVRHRRREKSGGELPLFPDADESAEAPAPPEPPPADASSSPYAVTERMDLGDEPVDLPLRPLEPPPPGRVPGIEGPATEDLEEEGEPFADAAARRGWPLDLQTAAPAGRPVERPAFARERAQAGAVDFGLLLGLWAVVVYFASRAAHVPLPGLLPTWPYLAGYLAFLGLTYAGYFTGTTGQTLGKIAFGLRVVDTAGQPPGYVRAFLRALLGALGAALLFAGMAPVLFDPARRALHDRVFRTRVIKG